jgi:hypothetical protein
VYDVLLDNVGGTESLRNCLSFDTEIESVYLFGNFGVFTNKPLEKGEGITYTTDGGFYIANLEKIIDVSKLIQSGLLFFAGDITFEKEIEVDNTNAQIVLDGRFAVSDVTINDHEPQKLIFEYCCDISRQLKKGKNKLRIRLVNGNRNLLGPHHFIEDEPLAVGPNQFFMEGEWGTHKAASYLDRYSFVTFGMKNISLLL